MIIYDNKLLSARCSIVMLDKIMQQIGVCSDSMEQYLKLLFVALNSLLLSAIGYKVCFETGYFKNSRNLIVLFNFFKTKRLV